MAIRFRLPAHAMERVAHAYSPLLEAVLSLHVLVEPKHHPLQHPWMRQMRALPAPLKREIAAFAFAYRRHDARTCFAPSPEATCRSFEDEVDALRTLHAARRSRSSSRGRYTTTTAGGTQALVERRGGPRAHRLSSAARAGRRPPSWPRLIFEDPAALADRFAELVWATTGRRRFAEEWERLEPQLRGDGRRGAAGGSPPTGCTRSSHAAFRASSAIDEERRAVRRSTSRTTTGSPVTRRAAAPPRPERLRLAARPGQLRRAVASEHDLPGAVSSPSGASPPLPSTELVPAAPSRSATTRGFGP